MRIAAVADAHIDHGVNGLWADKAWKKAVGRAIDEKVDCFLVAGDLFRDGRPSGAALGLAAAGMKKLANQGIPTVMVIGNHELIRMGVGQGRQALPPAMMLNFLSGVQIVRDPSVVRIGDLAIACLPWPDLNSPKGYVPQPEGAARLAEELIKHTGPVVCLAHAEIAEAAFWGSEKDLPVVSSVTASLEDVDIPMAFAATLMGHIHKGYDLSSTCRYLGSTERFTFIDEGQDKGMTILEWEDSTRSWKDSAFVKTAHSHFRTLTVEEAQKGQWSEVPEGCFVRVRLEKGQSEADFDKTKIEKAGFRYTRPVITKETGEDTTDLDLDDARDDWLNKPVDWVDALCRWLATQDIPDEVASEVAAMYETHIGWQQATLKWGEFVTERDQAEAGADSKTHTEDMSERNGRQKQDVEANSKPDQSNSPAAREKTTPPVLVVDEDGWPVPTNDTWSDDPEVVTDDFILAMLDEQTLETHRYREPEGEDVRDDDTSEAYLPSRVQVEGAVDSDETWGNVDERDDDGASREMETWADIDDREDDGALAFDPLLTRSHLRLIS